MRRHTQNPVFNPQGAAFRRSDGAVAVPILDIVKRDTWQVRRSLSKAATERYANTYKEGGDDMPPIRLASIGPGLVLLDGWHRLAALEAIGLTHALAIVEEMSEEGARWAAASANLTHGLPLRKKELREVFRAYVEAGQHQPTQRKVKPLRDIATDIPGTSFHTIRNWLKADFPALYRKHYERGRDTPFDPSDVERKPRPTQRQLDRLQIAEDVQQATARALTFTSAKDRQWAADVLRKALAKLDGSVRDGVPPKAKS